MAGPSPPLRLSGWAGRPWPNRPGTANLGRLRWCCAPGSSGSGGTGFWRATWRSTTAPAGTRVRSLSRASITTTWCSWWPPAKRFANSSRCLVHGREDWMAPASGAGRVYRVPARRVRRPRAGGGGRGRFVFPFASCFIVGALAFHSAAGVAFGCLAFGWGWWAARRGGPRVRPGVDAGGRDRVGAPCRCHDGPAGHVGQAVNP